MGSYDAALKHLKERQQFGSPLAGFQLMQEKLVRMLGNAQAMYLMSWRLSELFVKHGQVTRGQSSLVKAHNTLKGREVVALAREVLGGNGIIYDNVVARHFLDMEAAYTYEGTYEVNALYRLFLSLLRHQPDDPFPSDCVCVCFAQGVRPRDHGHRRVQGPQEQVSAPTLVYYQASLNNNAPPCSLYATPFPMRSLSLSLALVEMSYHHDRAHEIAVMLRRLDADDDVDFSGHVLKGAAEHVHGEHDPSADPSDSGSG
jgi:hypothetical protein